MNPHDLLNLEFVMQLDDQEFDQWCMTLSESEIGYVLALIQQARALRLFEIFEVADEVLDSQEDLSDAKDLLKKFTLNQNQ